MDLKSICTRVFLWVVFSTLVFSGNSQTFKKVNIEIAQDSIAELELHPYTNEDVHGNFIVNDVRFDNVEIHYRGAYYLRRLIKDGSLRNWKIKTSKTEKFENRREWNFTYEDYIRQNLSYHIYREANVPCVSTENVILWVNNIKQGLYLKYEDPDNKDWLADMFGDDEGDLYKAAYDLPGEEAFFADLTYLGDKDEDYFLHYRKQTNKKREKEFDYSSIREFTSIINHTPDAEFEATIAAHFDVDEFIRYLVVTNFTANWDTYPIRPKNFLLYNNPKDGLWHFIPWDVDATFIEKNNRSPIGTSGSVFFYFDRIEDYHHGNTEPLERPLVWRIMNIERYRNKYIYEYQKATESFLSVAHLNSLISSIQSGVQQNTSGSELNRFNTDVNTTRNFIAKRHAAVINQLDDFDVSAALFNTESKKLQVYPNPAKNYVNIILPAKHNGIVAIQVNNLLGQNVYSTSTSCDATGNILRLDLPHFSAGSYILFAKSGRAVFSTKLNVID